jgi:Putative Ig domain
VSTQRSMKRRDRQAAWVGVALALAIFSAPAQSQVTPEPPAPGSPLSVSTATLPKAFVKQDYQFQLAAQGGSPPFEWRIASGSLPKGMVLHEDGLLTGAPSEAGSFAFRVTVTDSGKPAHERNQELSLQVVAPLLAQWSQYPKVSGQRVEGGIKVSNQTEQDFDLTVVVLAVNETGRATALGYQHFTLKKDTDDVEIDFGQNLPRGAYQVNADVVGEVAETEAIHRARLVTTEQLHVQQGP